MNKFLTFATACGFAFAAVPGFAGDQKVGKPNIGRAGDTKTASERTASMDKKMSNNEKMAKRIRAVSGTVVSHKTVRLPGEEKANLVVMLKTAKGNDRLIVDLGNAKALENLKIKDDTKIQAQGRLARMGEHRVLVARDLKVGDKQVRIDRSAEMSAAKNRKSEG